MARPAWAPPPAGSMNLGRKVLPPRAAIALALAASAALVWWAFHPSGTLEDRVYRIGWQEDPPFQEAAPGGGEAGLSVELIKLAAQRRGIRLEWVPTPGDGVKLLLDGKLDLWPLMTILPEREGHVHITEPYLENQVCLLVRAGTPFYLPGDLRGKRFGVSDLAVEANFLRRNFRPAELRPARSFSQRMADLCDGRVDATFLDSYRAVRELLQGQACAGQPLRWIAIPGTRPQFGIGAYLPAAPVADALREEISVMAADGSLAQVFSQWGFMSSHNIEKVEQVVLSRRRERILYAGLLGLALLFVLAVIQALRIRQERNRTQIAERALRQAELRLRLVANSLREMVLAYDFQGRLIYANPALQTITGYTREELDQAGYLAWVHPEDRPLREATWNALFQGGSIQEYEYRLRTKSGEVRWMAGNWAPLLDDAGQAVGVQGAERDITTRKTAQLALQESERRFRKLLESIRMYAVVFDLNGYISFCNEYLFEQTGFTRQELEGAHLDRVLPEFERPRIATLVRDLATTGEPAFWHGSPKVQTKSGQIRNLETHNVLLRDPAGQPYAVATLGVDVTDHLLLQQQYLEAQKLESIGRLAGGVAHDFNNLLTAILGSGQLAALKLPAGHPAHRHIDTLLQAGEQAADLTRQLLAFSRKQVSQPSPLHLGELLQDSAPLLRTLISAAIELRIVEGPALWHVLADRGQLQQVLLNLTVNARDAMPHGGALTLETANFSAAAAFTASHPDMTPGDYVQLTVTDTGAGMDEETRARIFEPFYTTKRLGHGTGLGLATVYGIVRQCGGWIFVESEPGSGATFRLLLPRTQLDRSNSPGAPTATTPAPLPARGAVLLVEDQPEVRRMAATALTGFGYQVLEAASGQEALTLLTQSTAPIDLLFTDVVLPGMNGRELATLACQLRPSLRVLFASGYPQDILSADALPPHAHQFLAKPYSLSALADKVRIILAS